MKAVKVLVLSSVLLTSVFATSALANTVENNINNIRGRVHDCSILPYHYKNNNRVDHAIQSHCPEVKLLPAVDGLAPAKVKVAGHQFIATLQETIYSDGDVYDVVIRDVFTNDSYKMTNVLAFGDVLLGILGGSTNGLVTSLVNN